MRFVQQARCKRPIAPFGACIELQKAIVTFWTVRQPGKEPPAMKARSPEAKAWLVCSGLSAATTISGQEVISDRRSPGSALPPRRMGRRRQCRPPPSRCGCINDVLAGEGGCRLSLLLHQKVAMLPCVHGMLFPSQSRW